MSGKIFCLGFQKTGTTSLARALAALGYKVGDAIKPLLAEIDWQGPNLDSAICKKTLEIVEGLDAIQDSPCAFLHREFDAVHPGSKFILTLREVEDWLESYRQYFPDANNPLRRWMYGVDRFSGHEAHYRALFLTRNAEIIRYFADRPDDLLILDLAKGDGWLELVTFLGKDFLKPFPHINKAKR